MELRHLRYFVAVAEAGNFHRAAESLHLSQPPLSRQMQQLGQELGVALFEPAGRGVRLTSAGRTFLQGAKATLAAADAAIEAARETTDGTVGTIAIGFVPGAAYLGSLPKMVALLRERRPRVTVKLSPMTTQQQWEALRAGDIDFAYGNYEPDEPTFRGTVLARTRIGVLLPGEHRLVKKTKIRVADLAREVLLMQPRALHPRLHDDIIAAVRARGVVLEMAEIADREAIWTFVASGLGATFAGERGASFLDGGAAVWRPLKDLGVEIRDVATWRRDAERSPRMAPLIEIVDEVRAEERPRRPLTR